MKSRKEGFLRLGVGDDSQSFEASDSTGELIISAKAESGKSADAAPGRRGLGGYWW